MLLRIFGIIFQYFFFDRVVRKLLHWRLAYDEHRTPSKKDFASISLPLISKLKFDLVHVAHNIISTYFISL